MTELQSVVCSEWHTDNDVQEIYHCSVYNLTHENVNTTTGREGPTLSGPARPGPMTSQPVPGPLKFVNFRPKPGPYGPGLRAARPVQGSTGHVHLSLIISVEFYVGGVRKLQYVSSVLIKITAISNWLFISPKIYYFP